MPNRKKLPEGRSFHIGMGVNAGILQKLDELRLRYAWCAGKSDGQIMKELAVMKLIELT